MIVCNASSWKNFLARVARTAHDHNTWPAVRKKVLAVIAMFIIFFLLLFLLPWDE